MIRGPFVARLFRISPPAHGMFYRAHCGDHDWGVAAPISVPVPEKIPQSGEFSRQRRRVIAATPRIAPPRDDYPGSSEVPSMRMRIRATKSPFWRPMTAKIRSARLRRGSSMLRLAKAQCKMESRGGCHPMAATHPALCGAKRMLQARFSCSRDDFVTP